MKKIGILYGREESFPQAFIDRVNSKGIKDIVAESVTIDMVQQAAPSEYAVIIDRISQDVPFYRAFLKNAAMSGTAVINNPFWWSADEKFFNNAIAESVGVPVPKTVILPSYERPDDTSENSFRNLKFPYGWDKNFEYVGFPAYMKPHDGGGWKHVYKVNDAQDLFNKHAETGQLVMLLQEEIDFTEYFRCYVLGGTNVHIMQYEPRNEHHLRYVHDGAPVAQEILDKVKDYCIRLNQALGYDFNTVEFAIRDGIPYAIDFCNPAPDADVKSVGEANFEWIVENAANMAIEKAKEFKPGKVNLTWGTFVKDQFPTQPAPAKKAPVKRTPAKKAVAKKAPVKKAPVKKVPVKKAPVVKAVAKKAVETVEKVAEVKPVVKKAPAKRVASKKTASTATKTPAKKTPTKTATSKAAAKTPVAKKAPAKRAPKK
ncbi:hypothetical protein [Portibacter lacus]|uniref:ATP-grasp domain-containing protein n=1 Tax=Portibacter lacus TaxID=1099794 RepID=A0AA37WEW2_9BACT|nr:hypothetical protein [Portibacter lacus]GLR17129.1 hypothetical protein GCM10007940_17440 [Portibacter lacus]